MSQLDDAVEVIRAAAGAEFGFVLSRQGLLVTKNAPLDMPQEGRMAIVQAAGFIAAKSAVVELRMRRSDLVPFGGPSQIDVFVSVAAERAIVCLVSKTPASKKVMRAALEQGLKGIEPMLQRVFMKANKSRTIAPQWNPTSKKAAAPHARTSGSVRPPSIATTLAAAAEHAADPKRRSGSHGKAKRASALHDTGPQIVVERARRLGADTLEAIEADIASSGAPMSPPRIPPEALRKTLPWVDPSLIQDGSAAPVQAGRQGSMPEVTVRLEDAGDLEGVLLEIPVAPPSSRRRGGKGGSSKGTRRGS